MGGGWRRDTPSGPIYCPATGTSYTDEGEFLAEVCIDNGFATFVCSVPGPCWCE
jgi:hypothetical protein